jgi:hypothetical protein
MLAQIAQQLQAILQVPFLEQKSNAHLIEQQPVVLLGSLL